MLRWCGGATAAQGVACGVALEQGPVNIRRRMARRTAHRGHGWLAGNITRGGGFGLVGTIAVGVLGAVLGGVLPGLPGITKGGRWSDRYPGVSATPGAVALLSRSASSESCEQVELMTTQAGGQWFGGLCRSGDDARIRCPTLSTDPVDNTVDQTHCDSSEWPQPGFCVTLCIFAAILK